MATTVLTLSATGSYVRFLGQQMEVEAVATDADNDISQHTIEFSDSAQRFVGDAGYTASDIKMQSGFPKTYLSPGVGSSEITRWGAFLTTGTFALRTRATPNITDTGWISSGNVATVTVLPRNIFPSTAIIPNPDQGSDGKVTPKVFSTKFDDGYEQRIQQGLNNMPEEYSPKWAKLPQYTADSLIAFFEANAGVNWFYWRSPNALAKKKWVATNWQKVDDVGGLVTVSANFRQVFDPA